MNVETYYSVKKSEADAINSNNPDDFGELFNNTME